MLMQLCQPRDRLPTALELPPVVALLQQFGTAALGATRACLRLAHRLTQREELSLQHGHIHAEQLALGATRLEHRHQHAVFVARSGCR